MGTRLELQEVLQSVFVGLKRNWLWDPFKFATDVTEIVSPEEARNRVYFQPPLNAQMIYPCIVYSLDNVDSRYADNRPYGHDKRYTVMVIDRDPDSVIPDRVGNLPVSSFKTKYEKNNLNHFVFQLYF